MDQGSLGVLGWNLIDELVEAVGLGPKSEISNLAIWRHRISTLLVLL